MTTRWSFRWGDRASRRVVLVRSVIGGGLLMSGVLLSPLGGTASAQGLRLALPIDCRPGESCAVQNYPDHDVSAGVTDFTCGPQAYDGHTGLDIRLPNLEAMRRGVVVKASAAGVVRAVRDGMDDVNVRSIGEAAVRDRFAGNAVVLQHPDGWVTQYSHLRKGSVQVKPGQAVEVGQPLGLVGLSGMSEFPHVELAVLRNGKHVDPFTGQDISVPCTTPGQALWTAEAAAALAYQPMALLQAGFATETVAWAAVQDTPPSPGRVTAAAPALVFWTELLNLRAGDQLTQSVRGPDGRELARHTERFAKQRAVHFQMVGRKKPADGWPVGVYTGTVTIERDGGQTRSWSRVIPVDSGG